MSADVNILYCNNTGADLRPYHAEIAASLRKDGTLPEELADLFVVTVSHVVNPDGSPRYLISFS